MRFSAGIKTHNTTKLTVAVARYGFHVLTPCASWLTKEEHIQRYVSYGLTVCAFVYFGARPPQDELLLVQGATATSECLATCAAAMHDADSLIEIAVAEMGRGVNKSGIGATNGSGAPTGATRGRQQPP